jgi:hypothetical protein
MQVSTNFSPRNRFDPSGSILGYTPLDLGRPSFFDSLIRRFFDTFEELARELGAIFGRQMRGLFIELFHRTCHFDILPRNIRLVFGRKIEHTGMMCWKNGRIFTSKTLRGEYVGLEEIDDGIWSVYYGPVLLARFDEREMKFHG